MYHCADIVMQHGASPATLFAYNIEFNAMPNDFSQQIVAYNSHQALNRSSAKLTDLATSDANGVMVVLHARKHISWGAVQ